MTLLLIDGHAILHRAYHALPPLNTSQGELVNAVFGFTSMLLKVIHDLEPTHMAVAFDLPKPTFREKIYKDYQAQRPKMPEELAKQVDLTHRVIEEMGIPIFEMEGYEADDIIGTIAKKAKEFSSFSKKNHPFDSGESFGKFRVIIVTGDRDMLQLVDEKTFVYMPLHGLSLAKLYGEKEVEEKFGIKPGQIVDYKALVGDSSDNYSGVVGIGPKTAVSLLKQFGTLEEIFRKIHTLGNEKIQKALLEQKESAELAKKLATIETNVPLLIDWERCKLPNLDKENVHSLFERLEFRSLMPRLAVRSRKQRAKKEEKKSEESNHQQIRLF